MKILAHRTGWVLGLVGAAVAAAMVVLLAGCGESSNPPAAPSTTPTTSAPATEAPPSQQASAPGSEQGEAINSIAGAPERLAAPTEPSSPSAPEAAGLTWAAPDGWVAVPTTPGGMRAAQYTAPAPAGSALVSAEVVFFYFGAEGQGGDVSSNLARWSEQMLDDAGAPTAPSVAEFQQGDLHVTTAVYTGTYLSGMPGGERTPKRGWSLVAAIVEGGPQGSLFIRMTGPDPVVDAQREAFEVMLRTMSAIETDEPAK